jgi:hypothetical protein
MAEHHRAAASKVRSHLRSHCTILTPGVRCSAASRVEMALLCRVPRKWQ